MNNVANFIDKIDLSAGVAAGATSLTLVDFSALNVTLPTALFTFVIWNSTDYSSPSLDPAREVCVCSNVATRTLTYTNAQESTSNVAHNTAGKTYSICIPFTKALYDALVAELNLKATLASPTFTGIPTVPTATQGTNTTQVATTAFVNAKTKTIRIPLGFTWSGELKTTTVINGVYISLPTGQTAKLVACKHSIASGTSATISVKKDSATDVTNFTGISVTTTPTDTNPTDYTLTDGDYIYLVATAVSGTPTDFRFTLFMEVTV